MGFTKTFWRNRPFKNGQIFLMWNEMKASLSLRLYVCVCVCVRSTMSTQCFDSPCSPNHSKPSLALWVFVQPSGPSAPLC